MADDFPILKNSAYTMRFPVFDTSGLKTGLTSFTSLACKDGGTWATTTNSVAEETTGTAAGFYSLALTATEMNGNIVEVAISKSGYAVPSAVIHTVVRQMKDQAFPNVSGRGMDVTAGGDVDAVVQSTAANAITATSIDATLDVYTAFVWMTKDGTTSNRYSIIWFKNGAPITSGTSAQLLTVTNEANTVLVNGVTPTEVGTSEWFIWDEGTNKITTGVNYMVKVSATIDGSTRTWETPLITRDA